MTSRGRTFAIAALMGLFAAAGASLAQAPARESGGQAAATRPSATTRATAPVLNLVPADAWGVVGINNLSELSNEAMRLMSKLGVPPFFSPSGLIQMGLGLTQGFDDSGSMAMIFLDRIKYGDARSWTSFGGLPAPMVLAIPATDPQLLIKGLAGEPAEEEGVLAVTLGKDPAFATVKGSYVLVAPDASLLKAVAGTPATQPVTRVLQPGVARQINGSNLFVMVNVKPIAAVLEPIVQGLLPMLGAAAQGAQAQAGTAGATPDFAAIGSAYFDILSKQVDRLVVLGNLDSDGLMLSALVTFQPDTLLNEVFAATKPTDQVLLAGLPEGQFVLAAGQVQTTHENVRELAELFGKPMLEALKGSASPVMAAAAERQERIMNLRIQLAQMQESSAIGIYLQPKGGENGLVTVTARGRFQDAAKAYDLIRQVVQAQVEAVVAQQPKAKALIEATTYTPEAETSDSAKVHVLLLDVTKLRDAMPDTSPKEAEKLIRLVKTLFGTEGVTLRAAVAEKQIVATLGGGTEALKKAMATAKSNAAPLARQPGIVKVQGRLPKNRVSEFYLSGENALTAVSEVAKAMGEDPLPFQPGETSVPLAGMLLADPAGLHVALYVPTELMVNVRNMVNEAQMRERQQKSRPGGPTTRPATPPAEPGPEF